MNVEDKFVTIRPVNESGSEPSTLRLHIRDWEPDIQSNSQPGQDSSVPFVLVHGLASNAHTWNGVAHRLAATGHRVVAVDQRGHGLSDKPDDGYNFDSVTDDLALLVAELELEQPIIVGQSWGGNVMLALGVRHPTLARGLGFIDGGMIDLQARTDGDWEQIKVRLRPPALAGTAYELMHERMRSFHPDWSDEGITGTLSNFERLDDGTIRPWLSLERHMLILRALWEQRPVELYPQVSTPVLICPARTGSDQEQILAKEKEVAAAHTGLPKATVHWFDQTDHDIHVQRPEKLANLFLKHAWEGIWAR